jgi:hypothetical protein
MIPFKNAQIALIPSARAATLVWRVLAPSVPLHIMLIRECVFFFALMVPFRSQILVVLYVTILVLHASMSQAIIAAHAVHH